MSKKQNTGADKGMEFIALNLGKYEEKEWEESLNTRGWVDYGDDNLFPQYLVGLYKSSAVHSALCNSIAQMIYGGGPVASTTDAGLAMNRVGLDKALKRASMDLKIQGGFYLEVKWTLDRSTIKKVSHIPFEEIRSGHMSRRGEVTWFHHCLDWENAGGGGAGITPIPAYNPELKDEYPVQLLACFPFTVGSKYYPNPDYMGAINWIECDKQVSIYHNNNIANGLAPSFAINWQNGTPPEEKIAEIRRDIEASLTGPHNAGKFFMTFSDPDSAPTFENMALSDAHNQYQFVSDEATNKIMIGHRVTTPAMFGVKTAGQLGGTEEMQTGAKLFHHNVIVPYQEVLIDCAELLLTEMGAPAKVTIHNTNPMLAEVEKPAEEAPTELKAHSHDDPKPKMTEDDEKSWLAYLKDKGQKMDPEEWELVEEHDVVDPGAEQQLNASEYVDLFARYADADDESEHDAGLMKVRYAYSQNISDNSRAFCVEMVAASKAGTVYRYEDINEMSDAGVNSEFAEKGKSSYNIFLYKGGTYCKHKWRRLVYMRKRTPGGQFMPNDGLKNDKRVPANSDIKRNDDRRETRVATTPTDDLPNRGKVN